MAFRVLYLGDFSGTSLQRARACVRLGFDLKHISPRQCLPAYSWVDRIEWHLSPRVLSVRVAKFVGARLEGFKPDLVWVDNGSLVSRELVAAFRKSGARVVNFNHDDPYGKRDWTRFKEYRRAVPEYDLLIVVREPNIQEASVLGARDVMLLTRTADEVAHAPRVINEAVRAKWASEVAFVGTWMPERGPFMKRLVERGVPLSIFGGGWRKAPEWSVLEPFHRQDHLEGDDYAYAIQCAKISLGLLSKGNRDLHTTRSVEIPMLGGVLCAERTREHLAMYIEGREALFWRDADECAEVCLRVLREEPLLTVLAKAGRERALKDGNTSESLIRRVIERLDI
jgi:spore maturation protein CgeB